MASPHSTPTTTASAPPRIALIGCGAIAETFYLPAFQQLPGLMDRLTLIDSNRSRAEAFRDRWKAQTVLGDFNECSGKVDAAIIAVPHHLHHQIASVLLKQGIHVLSEKPLAETAAEAAELVALARDHGVTLAVNNTRRLFPASMHVRQLLAEGAIGTLRSLTFFDGAEFNWPTASGFYFDHRLTTKGVLLDIGAHVIDLICWWLNAKPVLTRAETDSFGGPEAAFGLSLQHGECRCDVRLSRLAKLSNTFTITGDRGRIEGAVYDGSRLTVTRGGTKKELRFALPSNGLAGALLENFIGAVGGNTAPLIPGDSVCTSIELIEEAYTRATRFSMPWYHAPEATV